MKILEKVVEHVNTLVLSDGQYGEAWHENKNVVKTYDDKTAFVYNSDFLVVAYIDRIYVYHEDDGAFCYHEDVGFDFASCFTHNLISLLSLMQEYITRVGIPYHYSPERVVRCGFALGVDIDKDGYKHRLS